MLGVYDFCGHYAWTFAWIQRRGGDDGLVEYWDRAISRDSQSHARRSFTRGFEGMQEYWGRTLAEEGAGYSSSMHGPPVGPVMRIDMYACPSRGFLLRNGLDYGVDYCDHCIGWIGPALDDAGFVVDHAHDHQAHCWWEVRAQEDSRPPSEPGELATNDVRLLPTWSPETVDTYAPCRPLPPRAQTLSEEG